MRVFRHRLHRREDGVVVLHLGGLVHQHRHAARRGAGELVRALAVDDGAVVHVLPVQLASADGGAQPTRLVLEEEVQLPHEGVGVALLVDEVFLAAHQQVRVRAEELREPAGHRDADPRHAHVTRLLDRQVVGADGLDKFADGLVLKWERDERKDACVAGLEHVAVVDK